MKFIYYIAVLLLLSLGAKTTAQTENIIVGDTVAIAQGIIPTNMGDYYYYRQVSASHSNPRFFSGNYIGDTYYTIVFAPPTEGKEIDIYTRTDTYTRLVNNNYREFEQFTFTDTIVASGIDSIVTTRIKGGTSYSLRLTIDTPSKTYKDTSFIVSFYNNIGDSTLFGNWSIIADSSLWFTVTADTNSVIIDNLLLPPFTRKVNVRIRVSTTLRPISEEKYIHTVLSTAVKNRDSDSTLVNNLTFILPRYKTMDTTPPKTHSEGISIYPNPSTTGTTIIIAHKESGVIQLGIYDDLGRLVKTLGTNEYPGMVETYYIEDNELPTGCYLVKAVSTSGTKVQKLIIY